MYFGVIIRTTFAFARRQVQSSTVTLSPHRESVNKCNLILNISNIENK